MKNINESLIREWIHDIKSNKVADKEIEIFIEALVNICKENNDKDVIINFLKKELIHKTSYRNVMKRQYQELKQKYDAIKPKERLLMPGCNLIAEFNISGWTEKEKQELLRKWKEINNRK